MKEYWAEDKETGERLELGPGEILVGCTTGLPAIVTNYYYSKPRYLDLSVWKLCFSEETPETRNGERPLNGNGEA